MTESILVFCAHSDDQIFGVGGTLAKYAKEGKDIHTVIFSFGELSHVWLRKEVTAEMRAKEAINADKIIGGKGVEFLGFRESKFETDFKSNNGKQLIKEYLKKYKPNKIFVHSINDPHRDHKTVYKLVMETLEETHSKADVYMYDVWNPLNFRQRQKPQMYVDISETFQTKIKALNTFKSQWAALFFLMWSMYARGFFNGLHINSKYAERFSKVR